MPSATAHTCGAFRLVAPLAAALDVMDGSKEDQAHPADAAVSEDIRTIESFPKPDRLANRVECPEYTHFCVVLDRYEMNTEW